MSLIRFPDMHAYERALSADEKLGRLTLPSLVAAETLGVSRADLDWLVRRGALNAVSVGDLHVYLDAEQVAAYKAYLPDALMHGGQPVRNGWMRHETSGLPRQPQEARAGLSL